MIYVSKAATSYGQLSQTESVMGIGSMSVVYALGRT